MNEVKQVWTSLTIRSPRTSTSPTSNNNNSNTRWYDVPVPVIIHNREFCEERASASEREATNEQQGTRSAEEVDEEVGVTLDEVLYQNNVEAALNSLSKICVEPPKTEMEPGNTIKDKFERSNVEAEEVDQRRRHSSSVELTATSSLKIGNDGVPTISFSFLRTEETAKVNEAVKVKVVVPEEQEPTTVVQDQLYDFPKGTIEEEFKVEEGGEGCEKTKSPGDGNDEQPGIQDELYDIPKASQDKGASDEEQHADADAIAEETSNSIGSKVDKVRHTTTRSLRSGRSVRITEDEIAEMVGPSSGSYSDPECPEGLSSESLGNCDRNKRSRRQRRRLGKAWGKMRSWLREERSKLGDVVTKHARMQAVGALQGATSEDCANSRGRNGSYDLAGSREMDSTTVVKVDELSAVSEEGNDADLEEPCSSALCQSSDKEVQARQQETCETKWLSKKKMTKRRTASTENVVDGFGGNTVPTSLSLDKLSSDGDNEENELKDPVGKGGLIKRRMLGSIRGLMASTHLLQTHDVDEVLDDQVQATRLSLLHY